MDIQERKHLESKVAMTLVSSNPMVFAAGPITKQPSSRPYRIVMADWGDKISVHTEYFAVKEGGESLYETCREATSFLDGGVYFSFSEMEQAQRIFADKLDHHCHFIKSIYRDAEKE